MTAILIAAALVLGVVGFFFAALWGYVSDDNYPQDMAIGLVGGLCIFASIVLAGVA